VRWPPATGCGGDSHGCVTVCFVYAAMMTVMLKYKQEASGRVCFLKTIREMLGVQKLLQREL